YRYRLLRPGSITAMGRNSFLGFYPLSIHLYDRYERYKNAYPEECKNVLKHLVDHSCMACLFADGDPRAEQCRQILIHEYADIMASDSVGWYKKWLTRQVISSGKLLVVMRILHRAKGRLRIMKERLNSRSLSGE
nr:hypothetical protein [Clostridiales bacterium]